MSRITSSLTRTRVGVAASALLAIAAAAGTAIAAETAPPEPEGFRLDDYRAPVPATLEGARVVTTAEAEALWKEKEALFVDVLPRPPKPEGLPEGTIWRDKPRDTIPGAVWLPNVGYGALNSEIENYFYDSLDDLTGDDLDQPLVFFCLAECWMSWNAAKRALAFGYTDVTWYPDGTDGWSEAGLPLERVEPVPFDSP